jgi:hypothetical protein
VSSGRLSDISNRIFKTKGNLVAALVIVFLLVGIGVLVLFGVDFASVGLIAMGGALVGWLAAYSVTRPPRWRKPVSLLIVSLWVAWWSVGIATVSFFPTVSSWLDPAYNYTANPSAAFLYGVQMAMLVIAASRLVNRGGWQEL